jgi:hypothetical protein
MSRALLVIRNVQDRRRALHWVDKAPQGTRIEFKAARRTLPQNDRFWAMLSAVAAQVEHCGRKYTAEQWKVLFLHACGQEATYLPALDGTTWIPFGHSSRDLSKAEMAEIMEFIAEWGARHGVTFHEDEAAA